MRLYITTDRPETRTGNYSLHVWWGPDPPVLRKDGYWYSSFTGEGTYLLTACYDTLVREGLPLPGEIKKIKLIEEGSK